MKTLDEVIIMCKEKNHLDYDGLCNIINDALFYLQEYKGLSKMWNDKLDKEQNNPPLSWEELKKLKGKPVWVEEKYSFLDEWYGQWEVIDDFFWEEPYFYGVPYVSMTDKENRRKDDLGKKWNAYRKERS